MAQVGHEEAAVLTHDKPVPGWTLVLRRQPVRIVDGRPEGGYTDAYAVTQARAHIRPAQPEVSQGGARTPGDQDQRSHENGGRDDRRAQQPVPARDGKRDQDADCQQETAAGLHDLRRSLRRSFSLAHPTAFSMTGVAIGTGPSVHYGYAA